jgi:hypothetical protein
MLYPKTQQFYVTSFRHQAAKVYPGKETMEEFTIRKCISRMALDDFPDERKSPGRTANKNDLFL